MSAVYYTVTGSNGITSCVMFSYPGGYSYILTLDALKSGS